MEHGWGQRRDDGNGLSVQVPEHGVGAPTSNEADDVGIDLSAEHGHCAPGPETASRDVGRAEVQVRQGGGGGA